MLFSFTTGCAVKTGPGSNTSSQPSSLILKSLPGPAEGLSPSDLTAPLLRGWEKLRAADFASAEDIFTAELDTPGLEGAGRAAALSGLGFVRLGLAQRREAGEAFGDALAAQPEYSPGLLGLAMLRRLQGRSDEIVATYELLSARHPQSAMLKLEGSAARLEAVQLLVRRGEAAAAADPGAAIEYFRQAIRFDPDLPKLYGLLAGVLDSSGRWEEALAALEKALSLSSGEEAGTFRLQLAWLELDHGKPERAVALFEALLRDAPSSQRLGDGLARAREKLHQASIPEEYRKLLDGYLPLDRGGLAAVIALEGGWGDGPFQQTGTPQVIRDAATHWAQPYIRAVVDHGVMDLFQDHTFRPTGQVSRGDLAYAACRLLQELGGQPADPEVVVLSDLSRDHRHYDCINRLVGLDLLERYSDNTVRINTPASGADALELVLKIRRLGRTAKQ